MPSAVWGVSGVGVLECGVGGGWGWAYVVLVVGGVEIDAVPAGGEEDFSAEPETGLGRQAWVLDGGCLF